MWNYPKVVFDRSGWSERGTVEHATIKRNNFRVRSSWASLEDEPA